MFNEFFNIGYITSSLYGSYEKYSEKDFIFHDSKFIETGNDITHYIELYDPSNKKNIILLHGIMVNLNTWKQHLDLFSSSYNVFTIDFLGHGLSTKREISLKDIVDQVHLFIQAKNIKKPIIIGHSLGGLVASIYASTYACELEKLIIISSIDYTHFNSDILSKIGASLLDFVEPFLNSYTLPFIVNTIIKKVYNNPSRFIGNFEDYLYHLKIKGFKKSIISLMKNHEYPGFNSLKYSNIKCPTLILHGDNDRLIFPDNAKILEKNIPNSRLTMIKNGSHMIIDEFPFDFISAVNEFIES